MRYAVLCVAAVAAFAQTNRSANDADRERLPDMASRMLERTVQARAALDKNDKASARHYVEEAIQNITAMETERPKAPQPFMVTLYTEAVQIEVKNPQPVGAGPQGAANRMQNAPVQEVTGESTRVAVNVTDAKQHLQTARDAIDKGDVNGAKQALGAVDGDLKAETAVGDLPLIKARENLFQALNDVRQQRFAEAVAPLRAASAGLNEYAQHDGRTKGAEKLRSDIDALAGTIQQDHNGADQKIADWSKEITGWIKPLNPPSVKR